MTRCWACLKWLNTNEMANHFVITGIKNDKGEMEWSSKMPICDECYENLPE